MNTAIARLGLIGNPIKNSRSHDIHNAYFARHQIPAIYSKYEITREELSPFLRKAKENSMLGLSVTMPFKKVIIPFLDEVHPDAQSIGAVNTVSFENGMAIGFNTDGIGALNALETKLKSSVANKKIVILGAGGAAKAIAWESVKRKATVTIVNRTTEKAKQLANRLGCDYGSLDLVSDILQNHCDVLIQTTPIGMFDSNCLINPENLNKDTLIFDIINKAEETTLLSIAAKRGCPILNGMAMWKQQALEQYRIWFKREPVLVED